MRVIVVAFQVMLVVGGNARKRGDARLIKEINPDINIYNWLG